jgi:hypothetical protein
MCGKFAVNLAAKCSKIFAASRGKIAAKFFAGRGKHAAIVATIVAANQNVVCRDFAATLLQRFLKFCRTNFAANLAAN